MGMTIPLSVFTQFSMLLIMGFMWFYLSVENHFVAYDDTHMKLQAVSKKLEIKEFENLVAKNEIEKFKIETLSWMEADKNIPANTTLVFHIRDKLRSPASVKELDLSPLKLEEVRTLFKEKNYSEAISEAEKELEKNPSSTVLPEFLFFLAESYYLTQQYQKSISYIEKLMTLYPENIMTGYAMLRLAHISEKTDQVNEAESVYKIIISQFQEKSLQQEAKKMLAHLGE
jgi:TolA-binding protein